MNEIVRAIADRYQLLSDAIQKGYVAAGTSSLLLPERYAYPITKDSLGLSTFGGIDRYGDGAVDEEEKSITVVISTVDPDRDGDIVVSAGVDIENFSKSPSWFWGHQSWEIPIGTSRNPKDGSIAIWPEENRVVGKCWFDQNDPDAMLVFQKCRDGFINSTSIAFIPLVAHRRDEVEKAKPYAEMQQKGWYFSRVSLTEVSWVGVGSNQNAVIMRDWFDKEKQHMSERFQKALWPLCAKSANEKGGCFSGWCPCPPCEKAPKALAKSARKAFVISDSGGGYWNARDGDWTARGHLLEATEYGTREEAEAAARRLPVETGVQGVQVMEKESKAVEKNPTCPNCGAKVTGPHGSCLECGHQPGDKIAKSANGTVEKDDWEKPDNWIEPPAHKRVNYLRGWKDAKSGMNKPPPPPPWMDEGYFDYLAGFNDAKAGKQPKYKAYKDSVTYHLPIGLRTKEGASERLYRVAADYEVDAEPIGKGLIRVDGMSDAIRLFAKKLKLREKAGSIKQALAYLQRLVSGGMDYADAEFKASEKYKVDLKELRDAYDDSQIPEDFLKQKKSPCGCDECKKHKPCPCEGQAKAERPGVYSPWEDTANSDLPDADARCKNCGHGRFDHIDGKGKCGICRCRKFAEPRKSFHAKGQDSDAYLEGAEARENDKPKTANPFPAGSEDAQQWDLGWREMSGPYKGLRKSAVEKDLKVGDRVHRGSDPREQGFRMRPENVGTVVGFHTNAGVKYADVKFPSGRKSSYAIDEWTVITEPDNMEPKKILRKFANQADIESGDQAPKDIAELAGNVEGKDENTDGTGDTVPMTTKAFKNGDKVVVTEISSDRSSEIGTVVDDEFDPGHAVLVQFQDGKKEDIAISDLKKKSLVRKAAVKGLKKSSLQDCVSRKIEYLVSQEGRKPPSSDPQTAAIAYSYCREGKKGACTIACERLSKSASAYLIRKTDGQFSCMVVDGLKVKAISKAATKSAFKAAKAFGFTDKMIKQAPGGYITCPKCDGKKKIDGKVCDYCDGAGKVESMVY